MRIFLIRFGAYGDCIMLTALIRYLKSKGHEIYLNTSERGMEVFQENPHIDKIIEYKSDSIPMDKLDEYWKATADAYECDISINMSESCEVALSLHPSDPSYNLPKNERFARCNINYTDYTFTHAKKYMPEVEELKGEVGELFFTDKEEQGMKEFFDDLRKTSKFIILWGLAGSGTNKCWAFTDYVHATLLKEHPEVKIITVGGMKCQILEVLLEHENLIKKSGKWPMRASMLAAKYADLVVCPDTGLLHAAGCFDTPKIGLFGHDTIINITKNFKNDYSIEAEGVECSPCFRLIYDEMQCPKDYLTDGVLCLSKGIKAEKVYERILEVIGKHGKKTE